MLTPDELKIIKELAGRNVTDDEIEVICKACEDNDKITVQIAKYINNINHAQDSHLGDHISQRTDSEAIKQFLQKKIQTLRRVNVPPLPTAFLPRLHDKNHLINLVTKKELKAEEQQLKQQITVIHGMPGVGKSVIAAELARDNEIRKIFYDGIIWVTIGQESDINSKLEFIASVFGNNPAIYQSLERTKYSLSELFAEKACLLILDDVWDVKQVDPFLNVLGSHCHVLITTRDASISTTLNGQNYLLKELDDAASLSLIANWLETSVDKLPDIALEVARQCGGLPLALAICAAMVRDGELWTDLLEALHEAELKFIEKQLSNYDHSNVFKAIKVSVDALCKQNDNDGDRYCDLVVFSPNVSVPEETVITMWMYTGEMNRRSARSLLGTLARKSLIKLEGDAPERVMVLHDLQSGYLIQNILESKQKKIAIYHHDFLKAHKFSYWTDIQKSNYYLWQNIAEHLLKANLEEILQVNVEDPNYLATKIMIVGLNFVLSDINKAKKNTIDSSRFDLLQQSLIHCSHILHCCENLDDLKATLYTQLQFKQGLDNFISSLYSSLEKPYFAFLYNPITEYESILQCVLDETNGINAVAISPDNKLVASASFLRELKLWNISTRDVSLKLDVNHQNYINDCVISASGRYLLTASHDETIEVWDLKNSKKHLKLNKHNGAINSCAISIDDNFIVSASTDRTLNLYDTKTGNLLYTFEGHEGSVNRCVISNDNQFIISASDDKTLRVWNITTKKNTHILSHHQDKVTDCAITSNGQFLVSTSYDGTLKIWNMRNYQLIDTLSDHDSAVIACAIHSNNKWIISVSYDQTLKVWDIFSKKPIITINSPHAQPMTDCAANDLIVSSSEDGTIKVWNIRGDEDIVGQKMVKSCSINSYGTTVAEVSQDNKVYVRNLKGKLLNVISEVGLFINDCAMSLDGSEILTVSNNNTIIIWNVKTRSKRYVDSGQKKSITCCVVSKDGHLIATGSEDSKIEIFDYHTGKKKGSFNNYTGSIRTCEISDDGNLIAFTADDGLLKVWDIKSLKEIFKLQIDYDYFDTICTISPDNNFIAFSGKNGEINIWSITENEKKFSIDGHELPVTGLGLRDNYIISTSLDRTIKVWNISSQECIRTLQLGNSILVTSFSANKNIMACASVAGTYILQCIDSTKK